MAGFDNNTMYADNVDFTGATNPAATVTVNGQLLIGSSVIPNIKVGTLTSPNNTITIGYASPNITLDLVGGTQAIERIVVDTATGTGTNPVMPLFGIIAMTGAQVATGTIGTNVIRTDSTVPNSLTIEIQRSTTAAASDVTLNGVSHFNSAQFSVGSNGFVSVINGGFTWTDVTGATQALAVQNGYLTDRGAGVVYTLPATAAIGDEIRIVGKLGLATVTPNANQQILMSSASGTVGVTGTIVATNVGDCVDLICTTSGASTVWRAANFVGNWTVN